MSDENVKQGEPVVQGTPKRKLGVSKDTVGKSTVPLPAPYELDKPTAQYGNGYHFPLARLVEVAYDPAKETKVGARQVLIFTFRDDEKRQYNHIEYPIDDNDAKFESKLEWLHQRLKHIWDETIGEASFPAEGLGSDAEDFGQLFKAVADTFNSMKRGEGEAARLIYPTTPLYIKLVYNRERLQFPLFPNFIQRAVVANKPAICTLNIVPSKDKITVAKSSGNTGYGSMGDMPAADTFAEGDYPDI